MNLADAIRQAALQTGTPLCEDAKPELKVVEKEDSMAVPEKNTAPKPTSVPAAAHENSSKGSQVAPPEPPEAPIANGSVVRLELFLSPEQLNGLLKAMNATQHTVMTLRETAAHLRVHPSALEQMAQEGQIPALLIEGRWRFMRSAVDEWLTMQSYQKETE